MEEIFKECYSKKNECKKSTSGGGGGGAVGGCGGAVRAEGGEGELGSSSVPTCPLL